ncbi:MAG: metal ABC transporter substrate-binding protein, partial [Candidatus Dormibacteraeota bacterium]|nr:metal ABC transporter substrate-binding protein [Candidatus Dormibacteraeota bacterium]
KTLAAVTLAGLLVLPSLACAPGQAGQSAQGTLRVTTTLTQVSALVRAVGGERVQLTALLGPNSDPHQYELKPEQVTQLARSAAVVVSGAGIDKWLDRGLAAAGGNVHTVDLAKHVHLRSGSAGEGGQDPHWWYEVDNAKLAAAAVSDELARLDPAGRGTYERNAAALSQRLDAADHQIHAKIDPIPVQRRLFVANHDAFNYFLPRYGISLVGDIVPATDSIAAVRPADVARLVAAIRQQHVCSIFTETTIDPNLAAQIARESGARVFAGKLYGDALGEPGSPGGTLEGALSHNGAVMAEGFSSC